MVKKKCKLYAIDLTDEYIMDVLHRRLYKMLSGKECVYLKDDDSIGVPFLFVSNCPITDKDVEKYHR